MQATDPEVTPKYEKKKEKILDQEEVKKRL